jgi:hypothetical protein
MGMTWGSKRQLIYASIVGTVLLGIGLWIGYPYFQNEATCFDGKQNGNETGADCGGSCKLACTFEVDQISLLWARSFRVDDGRYNAVAYLENQNPNTAVYKVKYRFRFADKNNVYIGSREGETFIPSAGRFAIFEPMLGIGYSVPVYTTFEFLEQPVWEKVAKDKIDQLKVLISDINLENADTFPRLSASMENTSLFSIPDITAIAILYDEWGNAINVSQTYFEQLGPEQRVKLNFTWAEPFEREVIRTEILPMYNVFLTQLK